MWIKLTPMEYNLLRAYADNYFRTVPILGFTEETLHAILSLEKDYNQICDEITKRNSEDSTS